VKRTIRPRSSDEACSDDRCLNLPKRLAALGICDRSMNVGPDG